MLFSHTPSDTVWQRGFNRGWDHDQALNGSYHSGEVADETARDAGSLNEYIRPVDSSFFERPILNSPYEYPGRHWELDADGQPTGQIIEERRKAKFIDRKSTRLNSR